MPSTLQTLSACATRRSSDLFVICECFTFCHCLTGPERHSVTVTSSGSWRLRSGTNAKSQHRAIGKLSRPDCLCESVRAKPLVEILRENSLTYLAHPPFTHYISGPLNTCSSSRGLLCAAATGACNRCRSHILEMGQPQPHPAKPAPPTLQPRAACAGL